MVDERQRQRQTPKTSNAMDNYYGFGRGLDVRNPQDLRRQQDAQAMKNPHHPIHANRNNMRGKDSYRVNVGPRPQRDTTGLGGLINRLDRRNIGYTDMLNALGSSFDPFSTGFGRPGGRFNEEYSDWEDKFGGDYDTLSGEHFRDSYTSSERQPGLEGNMGYRRPPSNRQPLLNQPPMERPSYDWPGQPSYGEWMQQIVPPQPMMSGIGELQEQAAVDPSDWRTIEMILKGGGNPDDYIETADASNIFDMYDQYKNKFGQFDFGDKEYSYNYDMPLGPGTLGIKGKYDFDDENAGMGINYSMSFNRGGLMDLRK